MLLILGQLPVKLKQLRFRTNVGCLKLNLILSAIVSAAPSNAGNTVSPDVQSQAVTVDRGSTYTCEASACTVTNGRTTIDIPQGTTVAVDANGIMSFPIASSTRTDKTEARDASNGKLGDNKDQIGAAGEIKHKGKKETKANNAKNVVAESKRFVLDSADFIEWGDIRANKVEGFLAENDKITIRQAERIELPDGLLTQVESFVGHEIQFHVGAARDVLIGCIAMRQVRDSDFTINDQSIIIEPNKGVEFDIADCGFAQNRFKAYSETSRVYANPNYLLME